jgi:hypothetical protein
MRNFHGLHRERFCRRGFGVNLYPFGRSREAGWEHIRIFYGSGIGRGRRILRLMGGAISWRKSLYLVRGLLVFYYQLFYYQLSTLLLSTLY